jgi:hypothetical protein
MHLSLAELFVQEKETELAKITAERSRLVHDELEQMQERERKHIEDNTKLKGQLKQLTKDFQYNLQLLKDRDTELELLENQIAAHKETSATRSKVRDTTTAYNHVHYSFLLSFCPRRSPAFGNVMSVMAFTSSACLFLVHSHG